MITIIVYVVFTMLALILLIGCIIVIRNAITIETFWKKLRKKFKDENIRQLRNMHSSMHRNIRGIKSTPVHEPSIN